MEIFVAESNYEIDQETLFSLHEDPELFRVLTPPRLATLEHKHTRGIQPGSTAQIRMLLPVVSRFIPSCGLPWNVRHTIYEPPYVFEDIQVTGPFRLWRHRHEFSTPAPGRTRIVDRVTWELPWPIRWASPIVRHMLTDMLRYRQHALQAYLADNQSPRPRP